MGVSIQNLKLGTLAALIVLALGVCTGQARAETRIATVAGGCFWCVEADFETVMGVSEVISGYTGGHLKDPTYKDVSRGGTGHYEAVQIYYDPAILSYERLIHLFLREIDPTDAGGQFCDRGDSYRTAIFVSDPGERAIARAEIAAAEKALGQKVATKVLDLGPFYRAEDYHQNYYKGDKLILTRAGPKRQHSAYAFYREACGRDARVKALWGDEAPFADH